MSKVSKDIEIQYHRSSNYRSVHADGFVGGPTTHGLISISVYSEYGQFPEKSWLQTDEIAGTGKEIPPVHQVVERLVESTMLVSPTTAIALKLWLESHIQQLVNLRVINEELVQELTAIHEAARGTE